ncbi:MAG: protein-L-isoaspartate(D-aspartate) O-methyltransferase [Candidatus Marinimicrobia bacterium]|nr:protein-L-isoaspartate(D-aspartate) O-methyltransferase [Candidatus Neomarinimicrobiota bacterium]
MFYTESKNAEEMVREQILSRDILDPAVVSAMRSVPRHAFVNQKYADLAYSDQPLPIGLGQTISQPYVVAFMTQALRISPKSRVLEIGTGSGYQAAVLSKIAREVYTVELLETLAKKAETVLKNIGIRNVRIRQGDGRDGWPEFAPFSHIIVTAASEDIPKELEKQLAIGGRMIIPVGNRDRTQYLVLVQKEKDSIRKEKILPVRFVPLVKDSSKHVSKKKGAA